jgi:4-amino-4-deoxy-L-arabinose transferase-like glycosyltransferase
LRERSGFGFVLANVENPMIVTRSNIRGVTSQLAAHVDVVCVLLIVTFTGLLFFVNLGSGPLWSADEQTYSQWGFHMAKTGDYLTPWAFGNPSLWIAKPPLYFWLMALAYQVFGVNNFSTRVWSPIFGILTCVVVFYLGKILYNRIVGLLSVLVLSTFFTFFAFARHAMLDVPLVFFMVASIFFFVLSGEQQKGNSFTILGGLFFGLALMTKQTTALLIPLILGPYLILTRRTIKSLFTKKVAIFLGVGILVITPWLIYMNIQFGSQFWLVFLLYNNVMRSAVPLEGHVGDSLFYFSYLVTRENILWIAILPLAGVFSLFKSFRKRSRKDILLIVWIAVVLGVFTVAQTKLFWYILPAFPAFAIVISSFLYSCFKKLKRSDPNRNSGLSPA